MNIVRLALESISSQKEVEREFYAKLVDQSQLQNAKRIIRIEQYGVFIEKTEKNVCSGQVRVRKTTIEGKDPTYEFTFKTPLQEGKLETNVDVDEVFFIQMKNVCDGGLMYTRHEFPITGTEMCWQIDCVDAGNGGYKEWCKIDLEIKGGMTDIPEFPIELSDVITKGPDNTDEDKEKIKLLFETVFRVPNPLLAQKKQD